MGMKMSASNKLVVPKKKNKKKKHRQQIELKDNEDHLIMPKNLLVMRTNLNGVKQDVDGRYT